MSADDASAAESHPVAAALLAQAGLHASTPAEHDRLLGGYSPCRAMAEDVWQVPLGDAAPLLLPPVDA